MRKRPRQSLAIDYMEKKYNFKITSLDSFWIKINFYKKHTENLHLSGVAEDPRQLNRKFLLYLFHVHPFKKNEHGRHSSSCGQLHTCLHSSLSAVIFFSFLSVLSIKFLFWIRAKNVTMNVSRILFRALIRVSWKTVFIVHNLLPEP